MGVVTALKAPQSFKGLGEKREEKLSIEYLRSRKKCWQILGHASTWPAALYWKQFDLVLAAVVGLVSLAGRLWRAQSLSHIIVIIITLICPALVNHIHMNCDSPTHTHTNLEAAHKLYNLWIRASIANTSPVIYGHWSAPWAVAARRVPIDKQLGNAMQKQHERSAKRIGKRKLAQWEPEGGCGPIILDRHLSYRPAASSVIAERSSGCNARLSVCRFWNLILWIFISFDFALIFNWFAPSISPGSIPLQFF